MARALKLLGLCLLLSLAPREALAKGATRTFALIVANNRSLSLKLPDLQYADDDAARYDRLFRSSGAGADVHLLVSFDRASSGLYPEAVAAARPATSRELASAVAKLAAEVRRTRESGDRSELYFVFAGHGEMAGGRGYLHLEDQRIDGAFIEREVIEKIPADVKHVLLDSCNSFFVINPRKPGGRRWATPRDMALGFSARHPEVGLFLSTNSNEEVFEWSELESGVFSHEVRSGLIGAADVNADGVVTYSELAGFVATANRGIAREGLRPQVYFNGPRGNRNAALFSPRRLRGRKLALAEPQARVWVRSSSGERLVDLHKERGPLSLTLPGSEELSVFVQHQGATPALPPELVEHRIEAGEAPVSLAAAIGLAPRLAARGDQLFGGLFAEPFGPHAYGEYLEQSQKAPEPVYGVNDQEIQRMDNYLTALADVDGQQRRIGGVTFTALGGLMIGSGVLGQVVEPRMSKELSIGAGVVGAAFAGAGLYLSFSDGPAEKALKTFRQELAAGRGNRGGAFARTEQRLQEVAQAEHRKRMATFWTLQVLATGVATAATIAAVVDEHKEPGVYALLYGSAALESALGFLVLSVETPTERLLRLYRDDPGIRLQVGVAPLQDGGFALGLGGTF